MTIPAVLASLRDRARGTTDLYVTAPNLPPTRLRLYEDGGRQIQFYVVGGLAYPDCVWHFPRGCYVLRFCLSEDDDESAEVFLLGLRYRGAYRRRLDLAIAPLSDNSGWHLWLCADGDPPLFDHAVPFAVATEEHPCIIEF